MPSSQDFFSRYWLYGVVALLLILNATWTVIMSGRPASAEQGKPAPAISLPRLGADGRKEAKMSLQALRGKVVVLDFWATWCGPCREALPSMAAFDRQMRNRGVAVLGVLTDDELAYAARLVHDAGVGYPVVVDTGGAVSDRYRIESLPTIVVIDRQGVIQATEPGQHLPETLARLVRPFLEP